MEVPSIVFRKWYKGFILSYFQYLFDASEAESWMSEQELYMMVEDRGKDEISAENLMKKHESLELAVDDYADTIRQLGETARSLTAQGNPLRLATRTILFPIK